VNANLSAVQVAMGLLAYGASPAPLAVPLAVATQQAAISLQKRLPVA
jgi:hypothetical protein